jgi:hypothetical protein
MKAKITAYQKLKMENEMLKQDIYNLVCHPDSNTGITTKLRYKIQYDLSSCIFFGSVSQSSETMTGLIINNAKA